MHTVRGGNNRQLIQGHLPPSRPTKARNASQQATDLGRRTFSFWALKSTPRPTSHCTTSSRPFLHAIVSAVAPDYEGGGRETHVRRRQVNARDAPQLQSRAHTQPPPPSTRAHASACNKATHPEASKGSNAYALQGEQREPSETFSSSPYMGSIGKYAGAFSLIQPLRNI